MQTKFEFHSSLDKIKLTHYVKFLDAPDQPRARCTFEYIDAVMMHEYGLHADGWDVPTHVARNRYTTHRVYHNVKPDGTIDFDTSLYVAFNYVTSSYRMKREQVLIEFNPNKSLHLFNLFTCYYDVKDVEIHKFDVAFDFPNLRRSLVGYYTRCDVMTYGTQDNNTLYIAPKTKDSGRIKVYQKDVERGDLNKRLRVEISLRNDFDASAMVDRLSTLHYHHRTEFQASTNDPLLYLLLQAPPWERDNALALMSRHTRQKYRKILEEVSSFVPLLELSPEQFQTLVDDLLAIYRDTDRA